MTRSYDDLLARGRARHGEQFSPSALAPEFRRYFESQERIRVETSGETVTGTVGATTGWRPVFILMRTARSLDSRHILNDHDRIVAVQRDGKYIPV